MRTVTASRALGSGFRAVAGESWLPVLGLLVTLARSLLLLPAWAFVGGVAGVALRASLRSGGGAEEAFRAVLVAVLSPRAASVAGGLFLAGALLWAALRTAWIAGAVPVLAWRLAGRPGERPRFRDGLLGRFPSVAVTGAAAFLLESAGALMLWAVAAGLFATAPRARLAPAAFAFTSALALAGSAFLGSLLAAAGELAVARAAMAGQGASRALADAFATALRRPAALVVTVLVVWTAAGLAAVSLQGAVGTAVGGVRGAAQALWLVPQVLLAVLSGLVGAAAELWRLAALGTLAGGDQAGRENLSASLRSESLGSRPPSQ